MNKPVELKINKRLCWFFLIALVVSFGVVFALQHTKSVLCSAIFPRTTDSDSYALDEYKNQYEHYLHEEYLELQKPYNENDPQQASEHMQKELNHSLEEVLAKSIDKYSAQKTYSYNPCGTQAYTNSFETYFGNTVKSDKAFYEKYTLCDAEAPKDKILYEDQHARLSQRLYGSPPHLAIEKNYYTFDQTFTVCDCYTTKHKEFVRLKAACSDFIAVIIIALILTALIYFVWKYKFKIRITN